MQYQALYVYGCMTILLREIGVVCYSIIQSERFHLPVCPGFRKRDEATGNQVRPKIMAPIMAKEKANAIGRNIFPSTPLNERMGIKTTRIITCPKIADFIIFEDPQTRFCP